MVNRTLVGYRARKEHAVQTIAGVRMYSKPGAAARVGEPLRTLLTDTPERFGRATEALKTPSSLRRKDPARTHHRPAAGLPARDNPERTGLARG